MCKAITKKGKQCSQTTYKNEEYCFFHKKVKSGEIAVTGTEKMFGVSKPVKEIKYPADILPIKPKRGQVNEYQNFIVMTHLKG